MFKVPEPGLFTVTGNRSVVLIITCPFPIHKVPRRKPKNNNPFLIMINKYKDI